MDIFKIANGPWEKLFKGAFQGHEVELYSNPQKILMILVFEKKLDRVEGAIVELYKVMHATGDVEHFTESLPREVLIVTKHDEKQTMKFFMLGSKPAYVRWTEDEFTREVDTLVKRLMNSAVMIKDVSKAYELTLKEISESSKEVQTAFFTQTMLVPLMATSSHFSQGDNSEAVMKAITKGDIILGLTRDKKRVVEPLALFKRVIVTDGEEKDRRKVLHIIGESALLSNAPVIFLDHNRGFFGLGQASKQHSELEKYEVDVDPIGFPVKTYVPRDTIKVNLNLISPKGFAEIFGVGDKDFSRIIEIALREGEVKTIDELCERISKKGQTDEFSEFEMYKAARILKLAEIIYPKLFGGKNEIDEMMKKGNANIARASIIDAESLDERSTLLLAHSLVRGIFLEAKNGKSVMIVLPN